jgi:prepilin-type processing-associated H-X9-DG protein
MYANENKGNYPRTVFQPTQPRHSAYTTPMSPNSFGPGAPGPNDVTAALFLLLRTQDIPSARFICPGADVGEPWDFGGRTPQQVANFPGRQYLNYSYASPYPSQAASNSGYKLSYTLTSDFAVAADMNPGTPTLAYVRSQAGPQELQAVNSTNHGGEGQNVLYGDGHVEFQSTVFAGMARATGTVAYRDNVYTAGASDGPAPHPFAPPQDQLDSVLLPTATEGPAPARDAPSPRASRGGGVVTGGAVPIGAPGAVTSDAPKWFWVLLVLGVLVLIGLAALVLAIILRPARATAGAPAPAVAGPVHPYVPQPYYGAPRPPPGPPAPHQPPPVPRQPPPLP